MQQFLFLSVYECAMYTEHLKKMLPSPAYCCTNYARIYANCRIMRMYRPFEIYVHSYIHFVVAVHLANASKLLSLIPNGSARACNTHASDDRYISQQTYFFLRSCYPHRTRNTWPSHFFLAAKQPLYRRGALIGHRSRQ